MPISEEMIIEWKLDRRYIVKEHKFSSTKKLCYMVLVDEDLAKAYVQDEKSDCKRMERLHRCIIPSPITGQPMKRKLKMKATKSKFLITQVTRL